MDNDCGDYSDLISGISQTDLKWHLQDIRQDYRNFLAVKCFNSNVLHRNIRKHQKQIKPFLGFSKFFQLSYELRTFKHCSLEFFVWILQHGSHNSICTRRHPSTWTHSQIKHSVVFGLDHTKHYCCSCIWNRLLFSFSLW